jgi:hypothetical protein
MQYHALPQFHPVSLDVGQYAARANWVYGANPASSVIEMGEVLRRSGAAGAAEIPPSAKRMPKAALVNILYGSLL